MTQLEQALNRRPSRGTAVRHFLDGAVPPLFFLAVNAQAGPRWGALAALVVAVGIAAIRYRRREPLAVIAASTAVVGVHSASAVALGEGRAFFLPEIGINAALLAVSVASLLVGRPATAVVCRRLGLEPGTGSAVDSTGRQHRWLTIAWAAVAGAHLVPLLYLYAVDSVLGLATLGTFFNKPTMGAMAVVTVLVLRRAHRRNTAPTAHDQAAEEGSAVPE